MSEEGLHLTNGGSLIRIVLLRYHRATELYSQHSVIGEFRGSSNSEASYIPRLFLSLLAREARLVERYG